LNSEEVTYVMTMLFEFLTSPERFSADLWPIYKPVQLQPGRRARERSDGFQATALTLPLTLRRKFMFGDVVDAIENLLIFCAK
jgi:hypothetical protein